MVNQSDSIPDSKGAVASFRFLDIYGHAVRSEVQGLYQSQTFGQFVYVPVGERDPVLVAAFAAPANAERCVVSVHRWRLRSRIVLESTSLREVDTNPELSEIWSCPFTDTFADAVDNVLRKAGALKTRQQLMRRIVVRRPTARALQSLREISSELEELSPEWLPSVPISVGTREFHREQPVSICHLHKVSYPWENSGGATRNLNIVTQQKRMGLDPYVITPFGYPDASVCGRVGFWIENVREVPNYRITGPGYVQKPPLVTDRLRFDTYLASTIVADRPTDLVHAASGVRGYELALKGRVLARALDVPLVYEVRSLHEHTWGGDHVSGCASELFALRMGQENRCMADADAVVTISESMAELLVKRGVSEEKISVVPNAVDLETFADRPNSSKAELGLASNIVVGYISNMSWREGHEILLKSVAELVGRYPELHCLLVGTGPERENIQALIAQLSVSSRVTVIGEVDHSEILKYYQAIDIFVVPRRRDFASDYVTPMKPYEAMAVGSAVIMSELPVTNELLGDCARGLTFPCEDVGQLTARIEWLLANPRERADLSAAAMKWVREERSWHTVCRQFPSIYRKAVEAFLRKPRQS
jgi:glycosyltransferase involved in cell wall biosynthesis